VKIERFEDIVAWQKAKELSIAIYSQFRDCRDYGFKDQICRAAVSIMNNIAEGFERQTNNELRQYLFIAKGSSGEVRSMLHLVSDLNYISTSQYKQLHDNSTEIARMLSGFIKKL
jgi:four helix bundle protein